MEHDSPRLFPFPTNGAMLPISSFAQGDPGYLQSDPRFIQSDPDFPLIGDNWCSSGLANFPLPQANFSDASSSSSSITGNSRTSSVANCVIGASSSNVGGSAGFDRKVNSRIRSNGLLAQLGLPCQTKDDYDYQECYSYYSDGCYNVCQFVESGDIEDILNHEKRKEKSRDAARSRRSRETEIFTDLANALPLAPDQVAPLDKASIMRLAISYLKVRDMVDLIPELKQPGEKNGTDGSVFLKSLDGFIVVLSAEGDFVYVSENVSDYLGLSQIDLIGQNIFEYSHPCDHEEIREIISGKSHEEDDGPKKIFVRLKCTLTSKGRSVNLKSAIYKVIQCTGHVVKSKDGSKKENSQISHMQSCFIAVGQPIPHPSNIETPLPHQTFLTKHGLDMKFTHADDEFLKQILGYDHEDLLGKSVYDYHHAMDSDFILSAYKCRKYSFL
ncbi:hypothetical protein JTB14_015115 [Gonioctena quinquepunctata]|nr:hypothetical protein JTB14_015115 [Gonioctena quinquepunctata]